MDSNEKGERGENAMNKGCGEQMPYKGEIHG